jgi:predicted glutamine amidotransferase
MCRLLTWVSRSPRPLEAALGPARVAQFQALGQLHGDGWGAAWWPEGGAGEPEVLRSTRSVAGDEAFSDAARSIHSDAGIVHLRWASPGMAVVATNVHPFGRGDLAMAHNGGIYPLDRVGELLPPEWEARVTGSTDSERYFLSVVAGQQETGEAVADVLARVVARIFARWSPSSLNAVCLTPESVVVVSAFDPRIKMIAVPEPTEEYYALRYRADADGVVVASSGIDQAAEDGWRLIDNLTLVEIRRGSLDMTFRPLDVSFEPAGADAIQAAR